MRYEAFISYSHQNERSAAWVQRALERYRIPKHLVRELGRTNERFRPLFRDKEELAGSSDLSETLRSALNDSANLIVICSPAAAQSRWVNTEIEYFIGLGRRDRIFAVIADGDPANPATCIPPALHSRELLALDLRPGGDDPQVIKLKLAATLLDIEYDRLRQRDRQYRRTRLLQQTAAVAGLAAISVFATYRFLGTPPCAEIAQPMYTLWGEEQTQALHNHFNASGLPFAADAARRIDQSLQGYRDAWAGMGTDACEATLVAQTQSPELMDLRMACLHERKTDFAALTNQLLNADTQQIENGVDLVNQLRPLARCADREQLLAAYPLPEDETAQQSVVTLQRELANLEAQRHSSQPGKVATALAVTLPQIEALDYPPLLASAQLLEASLQREQGNATRAREALYAAAATAVTARDDELIANAWISLSQLLVDSANDVEEAKRVLQLAQAHVAKLPADHPLESDFFTARSELHINQGAYAAALKQATAAADVARRTKHPSLSQKLALLASVHSQLHDLDAAAGVVDEAQTVAADSFGKSHPSYAQALSSAARIEGLRGGTDRAYALRREALRIYRGAYGDAHQQVVSTLERVAWSAKEIGKYEEAIGFAREALVKERAFATPREQVVANIHNTLGDIYISQENYPQAMIELEAALAARRASGFKPGEGIALNNLGNLANRAGQYKEAQRYCIDALAVDETYLAADNPDLAYALSCIGEALLGAQQPRNALVPLERAHSLRNRPNLAPASLAWTRWLLGRALWESGEDRALGERYVRFARRTFADMQGAAASELSDVLTWMQAQGLSPAPNDA